MQCLTGTGSLHGAPQQRAVVVRASSTRSASSQMHKGGQPKLPTSLGTQLGGHAGRGQHALCGGAGKGDVSRTFRRCSIRCEATSSPESGNEKSDWRTDPVSQALHASKSLAQRLSDAAKVAGRWTSKNLP
eukprot:3268115-Pyramimonas_sp.AAC.2